MDFTLEFILKKTGYRKELEAQKQLSFSDETTDLSYGKYALLQFLSQDVLERLRLCFPGERGLQIYCYGLILCANGFVHMDQVGEFYQESFLSLIYRNHSFKMGYDSVRTLLHDLGMKGNPVRMFEQGLIDDSSGNVAIDGHVIRSCSSKNDLADPGYKVRELKSAQINVLIAYDTKQMSPVMYRTYRGSSIDKVSV